MKLFTWTTEKPTGSGWYFLRWRKGEPNLVQVQLHFEIDIEPMIEDGGRNFREVLFSGNAKRYLLSEQPGEWAGPLAPPEW